MKFYVAILATSISTLSFAAGKVEKPCAEDVCKKLYANAQYTYLQLRMHSVIIGEKAYQASGGNKDYSTAVEVYDTGMQEELEKAKELVSPHYQSSVRSAKGNKELTSALKEIHSKWLGGINSLMKYSDDQRAKELRYQQVQKEIDEAWAKVQTEAGI